MRSEYDFSKAKRGAVISNRGKERITIFLDKEVISEFRARAEETGRGYQTMINEALREYLTSGRRPVDEKTLRKILREELKDNRLTKRSSRAPKSGAS
ncbi:MAG: BrnA antitoxin family protein [Gammaproteobacteria bacterium]